MLFWLLIGTFPGRTLSRSLIGMLLSLALLPGPVGEVPADWHVTLEIGNGACQQNGPLSLTRAQLLAQLGSDLPPG